jgi:hypothetical protein
MATATKTKSRQGCSSLRRDYNTKFVAELQKELELKNVHQVPRWKNRRQRRPGRAKDDKKSHRSCQEHA